MKSSTATTAPDTTHSVRITGFITTQSPLHISALSGPCSYNWATRKLAYAKVKGWSPCTTTRSAEWRLPISATEYLRKKDVAPDDPNTEKTNAPPPLRLPILPAQGLRGRLRRLAARAIEDALIARGDKLSWAGYQVLHCGAATGNPSKEAASLPVAREQFNHILMGLFGGGPYMLPGALRVADGYPAVQHLADLGLVPGDYEDLIDTAHVWGLYGYAPILRVDDATQHRDPNASEIIRDYDDEMNNAIEKAAEKAADRVQKEKDAENGVEPTAAADDDNKRDATRTLACIQFVRGGVPFYASFSATHVNQAQIGLLLEAMHQMLGEDATLGGKSAVGFGRVRPDHFRVAIDANAPVDLFESGDHRALNITDPIIAACLDAKDAALHTLTSAAIDTFAKGD